MNDIFKSATRIVLLVLIVTLCGVTAFITIKNSEKSEVVTGILSVFSMVASSTVAFYFKNSGSNSENEKSEKGIQYEEKTTSQNAQETQSEA